MWPAVGQVGSAVNILSSVEERTVWVQGQIHQTDAGELRIWHLAEIDDQTLCGRVTRSMKALPKADWDRVMNPCPECQEQASAAQPQRGLAS